ncbi:yfnA [Symbiodinium natans]|uniref:YfnA protein n=1 Tax=Symbiodinium natans TaxID=878477 RepID=A0A812P7L2_9DINO|nr:yfnA [Symbiodinium natans]
MMVHDGAGHKASDALGRRASGLSALLLALRGADGSSKRSDGTATTKKDVDNIHEEEEGGEEEDEDYVAIEPVSESEEEYLEDSEESSFDDDEETAWSELESGSLAQMSCSAVGSSASTRSKPRRSAAVAKAEDPTLDPEEDLDEDENQSFVPLDLRFGGQEATPLSTVYFFPWMDHDWMIP